MDLTERVLRSETDVLKKQALIKVKPTGMEITEAGETTVRQLNSYFNVYSDDHHLAQIIKENMALKMFMSFLVIQTLIKRLKLNYLNKPDS